MIAMLVLAAQAAPLFAPPTDRPLVVTIESVRTEGGVTRRFVGQRTLRFTATPEGFRVAVTLDTTEAADGPSDPDGLLRAAFARIAGRSVTLTLDRSGTVTGIEDEAATWRALVDAIAALAPPEMAATNKPHVERVRAVAAALAAQPEAARRAMLASFVAPLVGVELVAEAAGPAAPRAVKLPAGSVYGTTELDGLRSVRTRPEGIEAVVTAGGTVAITTPEGKAEATMTLETLRRVDPATGLVIERREQVETIGPDGALVAERRSITRILP